MNWPHAADCDSLQCLDLGHPGLGINPSRCNCPLAEIATKDRHIEQLAGMIRDKDAVIRERLAEIERLQQHLDLALPQAARTCQVDAENVGLLAENAHLRGELKRLRGIIEEQAKWLEQQFGPATLRAKALRDRVEGRNG